MRKYIIKKQVEDYEKRKKKKEKLEEKYIMEALNLLLYRWKRRWIIDNIKNIKNINQRKIRANKVYTALKGYLELLEMELINDIDIRKYQTELYNLTK